MLGSGQLMMRGDGRGSSTPPQNSKRRKEIEKGEDLKEIVRKRNYWRHRRELNAPDWEDMNKLRPEGGNQIVKWKEVEICLQARFMSLT
jgi:hypothetical protein